MFASKIIFNWQNGKTTSTFLDINYGLTKPSIIKSLIIC